MKIIRSRTYKHLLWIIHISFAIVQLLLWTNEIFDIPYRLGLGPKTPINFFEAALESITVAIIWIFSYVFIRKTLDTIKLLEGILPICANCKKIRAEKGDWQEVESYISAESDVEFSHSLCPECIRKLYPEMADDILKDNE